MRRGLTLVHVQWLFDNEQRLMSKVSMSIDWRAGVNGAPPTVIIPTPGAATPGGAAGTPATTTGAAAVPPTHPSAAVIPPTTPGALVVPPTNPGAAVIPPTTPGAAVIPPAIPGAAAAVPPAAPGVIVNAPASPSPNVNTPAGGALPDQPSFIDTSAAGGSSGGVAGVCSPAI
jgi:hypothetical protein